MTHRESDRDAPSFETGPTFVVVASDLELIIMQRTRTTSTVIAAAAIGILGGAASAGFDCPDATGDASVDIADLNLVLANFNGTAPPGTMGDVSGDGDIDIEDLNLILEFFGSVCEGQPIITDVQPRVLQAGMDFTISGEGFGEYQDYCVALIEQVPAAAPGDIIPVYRTAVVVPVLGGDVRLHAKLPWIPEGLVNPQLVLVEGVGRIGEPQFEAFDFENVWTWQNVGGPVIPFDGEITTKGDGTEPNCEIFFGDVVAGNLEIIIDLADCPEGTTIEAAVRGKTLEPCDNGEPLAFWFDQFWQLGVNDAGGTAEECASVICSVIQQEIFFLTGQLPQCTLFPLGGDQYRIELAPPFGVCDFDTNFALKKFEVRVCRP